MIDETNNFSPEDINSAKGISIISYLGFLFFVPLIAKPESPFAKFHANQGLVNFILIVILGVVTGVLSTIFSGIPILGTLIRLFSSLLYLPATIFAIMGIVSAAQGQAKRLPVIGNIQIIK